MLIVVLLWLLATTCFGQTVLEDLTAAGERVRFRVAQMQETLDPLPSFDLPQHGEVLRSHPDLGTLRSLDAAWRSLARDVNAQRKRVDNQLERAQAQDDELGAAEQEWTLALTQATTVAKPPEVLEYIRATLRLLDDARRSLAERRAELGARQNSLLALATRVQTAHQDIALAKEEILARLLEQDSAPLWTVPFPTVEAPAVPPGLGARAAVPAFAFVALLAVLRQIRWLRFPGSLALLATVLATRSLDPAAPRIWLAVLALLGLIPAVLLMRRVLDRRLVGLLALFFLADQFRFVAGGDAARYVLFAEVVAALLALFVYRRYLLCLLMLGLALATLLGYMTGANLVATSAFASAYMAAALYALWLGLDRLWSAATAASRANMVKNHEPLLRRRFLAVARWLLGLFWFLHLLELLALRETALSGLREILAASFGIGTLRVTLGGLLGFFLSVWLAAQISRFLRFALQEDVFPHLRLSRGVPYAISMAVHYVVLLLGVMTGLAALGVDTTKFTVVAGALSVGLGFGLQNVVNNFVSGLILLVDRPINVGDTIKLGEFQGELRQIGLRSSILVIGDGSEVIVPNSDLINQRVLNWTSSRRVELKMSLPVEAQPAHALEVVVRLASECPGLRDPQAFVLGFTGKTLDVQLQAWVQEGRTPAQVKSELAVRLSEGLKEAGLPLTAN